jgi:hypothetical protein
MNNSVTVMLKDRTKKVLNHRYIVEKKCNHRSHWFTIDILLWLTFIEYLNHSFRLSCSQFHSHSRIVTSFVYRVTQRAWLVDQEVYILLCHPPMFIPVINRVQVTQALVYSVVLCRSLIVFLFCFLLIIDDLCVLFPFDHWLIILVFCFRLIIDSLCVLFPFDHW